METRQAKEPPVYNNDSSENVNLDNTTKEEYFKLPKLTFSKPERTGTLSDTETYELEKFQKNAMVIFNHENFLTERKRLGTHLDVEALEDTFTRYRFQVTTHKDLTSKKLFQELKKFSKGNFKDFGCICVAILTHGQDQGYLRAYDTRYSERDAFACFDALANPTLAAKPIIFVIQACRGRTPAPKQGPGSQIELDAEALENGHYRPTESDIIIFHSSFFGRASVRVVDKGTWFIQTLCEQIKLHASTDHLEKLFRRVRVQVALNKEFQGAKQMPVVTTTLLKKLYLIKGNADGTSLKDAHIRLLEKKGNLFKNVEYIVIGIFLNTLLWYNYESLLATQLVSFNAFYYFLFFLFIVFALAADLPYP